MDELNEEIKNGETPVSEDKTEEIKAADKTENTPEEEKQETAAEETAEPEVSEKAEESSADEAAQTETETPAPKPEVTRAYFAQEQKYDPNIPKYNDTTANKEKNKNNSGAVIAILAAIAALAIIFGCCALVAGMMLRGQSNLPSGETTSESGQQNPEESKPSTDTQIPKDTEQPSDTEKPGPSASTDPAAVINLGDSKNKYALTEVAAMTVNSVVEIRTEQVVTGNFMQQYVSKGAGSGVIVTKDGYIATNNHVIDGATSITVVLRNGKSYQAALIGADSVTDIAVVKIDEKDLEPAVFGSSDKLVVAESVIAIGNPLGSLGGSVTDGIISALARNVTVEGQEMTLMQTTAAINPGNSGGGLFNMSGECIGIVNAKSSGEDIEGIGFAIPSDTAVPIIEDLIRYGYVRGRVMLGISMVEVNDAYTARRYGLTEIGVYISSVYADSDAEKAGLKEKDRIVSINGVEVDEYADVKRIIQKFHVGDEAEIVVKRNGETLTVKIVFTEYIPS